MTEKAPTTRRDFLKTAAAAGGALAAGLTMVPHVHAGGGDVLRIGLIGCGGRGTGAAGQALQADPNVKLVAMGDAFEDRLLSSLDTLSQDEKIAAKVDVKPEMRFVGFDAYKKVLASGVDVVLLTTPPHFRPIHLMAAVEAGKHVFAEKPVAVDAPGVRFAQEACDKAKKKGLSLVSGLCLRYDTSYRDTVKRLHDGAAGDVVSIHANDLRGKIWDKPRQKEWSDMEWQMRNWYYFTWLSGDFNVEQHVHNLDAMAWLMKDEYPTKAVGMGGRQVRTEEKFGNIYDHHSVVYEYPSGVKLFSFCRQQIDCKNDITVYVAGTRGTSVVSEHEMSITTDKKWRYDGPMNQMYQAEHDELFASIRSGKPINNGEYMCKSTLMAIMGRMATYTGQVITWDMALSSKENLSPEKYEWGPIPTPAVALPGKTKFI
jgi:predicted dehydrogenase